MKHIFDELEEAATGALPPAPSPAAATRPSRAPRQEVTRLPPPSLVPPPAAPAASPRTRPRGSRSAPYTREDGAQVLRVTYAVPPALAQRERVFAARLRAPWTRQTFVEAALLAAMREFDPALRAPEDGPEAPERITLTLRESLARDERVFAATLPKGWTRATFAAWALARAMDAHEASAG